MKTGFSALLPALCYGDKRVRLAEWRNSVVSREENRDFSRTEEEFLSPDGRLKVLLEREEFRDFPALRYRVKLVGCGDAETSIVSGFDSLDLRDELSAGAEVTVRALRGSKNRAEDFSSCVFRLTEAENTLDFVCDEGRSSAAWMPYFGFDLDENHGWEAAIGWSGSWHLRCGLEEGRFFCRFGMREFETRVRPGETLIQPSVLVFRREGATARDFQTVIHDFMVKHNSPRDRRGELLRPILPIGTSGGNHLPGDMKNIVAYAVRAGLPCDTLWVDAGWNGPEHHPNTRSNCGDCWSKFVGDWRVNTGVHPSGTLKGVADAAHAAGLRFLLWFEPERVMPGTPVFREHPEFVWKTPVIGKKGDARYVLNLGNDAAWHWIFDTLCRAIRENGVDIYRQDFNVDPAPVWAGDDEPGRRGVSEIRHVAGLYRLWDALRAEFPDLLIDNCASGGRRMDFELVGRSHVCCRSDYFVPRTSDPARPCDPEKHRGQIVLGQNATVNTLAWAPFQESEANCCTLYDDAEFFGALGTGIVFSAPDWGDGTGDCDFSTEETAWFRRMLRVADRVRRILMGKFYPLTDALTTSEELWAAYEGLLPETVEGFAAFFRRKAAPATRTFQLRGIDPAARWKVEDASTGEARELSGEELENFTVTLENAPSGRLIFFRKVSPCRE